MTKAQTDATPVKLRPDLVFYNGKIITADPHFSIVQAVAIYGGRFVAVGSDADIRALGAAREIDLQGRTVLPGLIDNHTHQLLAGLDTPAAGVKVNIATLQSIAEIIEAIRAQAAQTPPGEWLVTSCMYRGALQEGRFPNRWDLDRASTDHPIYIFQSGKNIIINSYALRLAGIDAQTLDPKEPEGHIVRDAAGEPTGHLIAGAADMARKRWWQQLGRPPKMWDFLYFDQETMLRALQAQQAIYNACGIVGTRDMGVSPDEVQVYQKAQERGELSVRTNLILGLPARYLTTAEAVEMLRSYFGPKQPFGDAWLRIGGLKLVVQNDGWWAYSIEKLNTLVAEANRAGWTLAFHVASGTAPDATEAVLSALEAADREAPIAGRRFSFEHGFGLTDPAQYRRAQRLGLIIAANPLLAYYGAARSARMAGVLEGTRIAKVAVGGGGRDRAVYDWGLPIRSWLESGLVVTGGSDNPAISYDVEQPFLGLYAAVTGDTLAGVLLPGEEASREQVVKMWTINNAYATFEEAVKGSIEPGKLADLTVISADFLTIPAEQIPDIKVTMTVVGGRIVYER
jgi:predicted amidohydrolase YtcJ